MRATVVNQAPDVPGSNDAASYASVGHRWVEDDVGLSAGVGAPSGTGCSQAPLAHLAQRVPTANVLVRPDGCVSTLSGISSVRRRPPVGGYGREKAGETVAHLEPRLAPKPARKANFENVYYGHKTASYTYYVSARACQYCLPGDSTRSGGGMSRTSAIASKTRLFRRARIGGETVADVAGGVRECPDTRFCGERGRVGGDMARLGASRQRRWDLGGRRGITLERKTDTKRNVSCRRAGRALAEAGQLGDGRGSERRRTGVWRGVGKSGRRRAFSRQCEARTRTRSPEVKEGSGRWPGRYPWSVRVVLSPARGGYKLEGQ